MYVDLIVDNGAGQPDQLFTYSIFGEEFKDIKSGDRLVVPFGNSSKPIDAIVWSVHDNRPDFKIKNAIAPLSKKYSFTRTQLFLMYFLRSNYASTYRRAYKTIMPSGQELVVKREYTVLKDGFLQLKFGRKLGERELKKLASKKEILNYIKKGLISLSESYDIKYVRKKELLLSTTFDDLESALNSLNKRAVKLMGILKYVDSQGVVEYSKVKSACSIQKSDINKLIEKKLLAFSESDKAMSISKYYNKNEIEEKNKVKLSPDQEAAISRFDRIIKKGIFRAVINGVTGSGKTRLYIEMAKRILENKKQVLILVPEISLTAQLISRIRSALNQNVAVLHTHVTMADKASAYDEIRSGTANIIIGARSALFAPFQDLGLIIIDESHEKTYKSEQIPRYSALKLAMLLSKKMDIHIALGSATTTVETFYEAKKQGYTHILLKNRIGGVSLPKIQIIDMANTERAYGRVSTILYEKLKDAFDRGEQGILLHNRRGHSAYRLCPECKHIEKCLNCDVSMSVVNKEGDLYCRYCDYKIKSYTNCSECGAPVEDRMPAVKSVKDDLEVLFPEKVFVAVDSDTTGSNEEYLNILSKFSAGKINALVGTQVIAKGLDFDNVSIAAIIDADSIFHAPDYTATERAFALMYQLSGRAGRRQKQGEVYIQAIDTKHRVLNYLISNDYTGFIREENKLRKAAFFPPYSSFVAIKFVSEYKEKALDSAQYSSEILKEYIKAGSMKAKVFRASEQYYLKIKNKYNYYVLIKNNGEPEQKLVKLLYNMFIIDKYDILKKGVHVSLDFEPSSL